MTSVKIDDTGITVWYFNGHFPFSQYQNVSILDFIGDKDDGGGGDNYSYKTCKAPNCLHQQTNIQFFTGWMPILSPNQQCQSTEGKITVTVYCCVLRQHTSVQLYEPVECNTDARTTGSQQWNSLTH